MFSLIHGLWKYFWRKDEYCILLLGLDNAGKSTFLEKTRSRFDKSYAARNLNRITSTVGLNVGSIETQGVRILFWDLGGQGDLQLLWDKYYCESHGLIYMIDSTDSNRMEDSKQAFERMMGNEALDGVPLLIVANKQDLPDALSLNRIREIFRDTSGLIGHRDCHAVQASAVTGDGVDDSINWMVSCVKRNNDRRPPKAPDD